LALILFIISTTITIFNAWSAEGELAPETQKLADLVKLAIENSPTYDSFKMQMSVSEMAKKNALSVMLPQLDLSATHGYAKNDGINPWDRGVIGLGLSETLYDNGQSLISYQKSKYQQEISQLQVQLALEDLSLQVSLAYFDYQLAQAVFKVKKFQNQLLLKQFHSIEEAYQHGIKPRIDYLRFMASVKRSNIELITYQNRIKQAIFQIQNIVGIANKENIQLNLERAHQEDGAKAHIFHLDTEETAWVEPSYTSHLQYRIADLKKQFNQMQVSVANRRYWPNINLSSNLKRTVSEYTRDNGRSASLLFNNHDQNASGATGQTYWEALVSINFNLWDWGLRNRNVQISKAQARIDNNVVQTDLLQLKNNLQNLMINLNQFYSNYQLSTELLELEQRTYRQLEENYRNGKATFLDIVNGVNDYSAAQESYYTNYYELKKTLMQYFFHKAELYAHIARKNE
jgi:outer membrane protein